MNEVLARTITGTLTSGESIEYILDEKTGTYLPQVQLPPQKLIGKFGQMRRKYLKEHCSPMYQRMVLDGTLNEHLSEMDEAAKHRVELILPRMLLKAGITEELKAQNQMEWIGLVNSITQAAEEIVITELIYN